MTLDTKLNSAELEEVRSLVEALAEEAGKHDRLSEITRGVYRQMPDWGVIALPKGIYVYDFDDRGHTSFCGPLDGPEAVAYLCQGRLGISAGDYSLPLARILTIGRRRSQQNDALDAIVYG